MAKSDVYTNDPYRATASNHINKVAYSDSDRILYIQFANGAYYEYLNVPKSLYIGMLQAPSHGAFFWAHIRQIFDYNKLQRQPNLLKSTKVSKSIQDEICPEQGKLNLLDDQEIKLNKSFTRCEISQDEYSRLYSVIQKKKDTLITKLTKMGYFEEETELEEGNVYPLTPRPFIGSKTVFWGGLGEMGMLGIDLIKGVSKVILLCFAVIGGIIAACS